MRIMFSIVGLLVALAVVFLLAKKQLQVAVPSAASPGAASSESAKGIEQRVQQDVQRALRQGAAATASAADRDR